MLLTCCENGSKVLKSTPKISPVADQVKLEELDLHRLCEGEVEQFSRFASCVKQLILHQSLPRAILFFLPRDAEALGCPGIVGSLSLILDPTPIDRPCTFVQF